MTERGKHFELDRREALTLAAAAGLASIAPDIAAASAALAAAPIDDFFGPPFVDIDEHRTEPFPHRYVHGGFKDTDTRFSFYFPPKEQYGGRFFQMLEGGSGGNEHTLSTPMNSIGLGHPVLEMAFKEAGAYVIESNQGHLGNDLSGLKGDPSILGYRASKQCARFARELAREMYGMAPHHGYVSGGSGGGYRTWLCMENSDGVWHGGVPYVISTEGIVTLSAHAYAIEGLGEGLAGVIDAAEPGGSGDPFAGLTFHQRDAVAVLYRAGWGRGAETQLRRELIWGFAMQTLRDDDPAYFTDFWTERGYAGADNPELVGSRLVNTKATVKRTLKNTEIADNPITRFAPGDHTLGIVVDYPEPGKLFFAEAAIVSGAAKGRKLFIGGVAGEVLTPFHVGAPDLFDGVNLGDEIVFDNRDFVAFCHYWMHGGVTPEQPALGVDGVSIYPVRPRYRQGELHIADVTATFAGKMIQCASTLDSNVFSPTAYERLLRERLGDRADDQYCMWWMENASHSPPHIHRSDLAFQTRLIAYTGYINQALRDVVAWVEDRVAPVYQHYDFSRDNALLLPPTARERGGIQPVVSLQANGGDRAEVRTGGGVTLSAYAEVPPKGGVLVTAEWDFDMTATWPQTEETAGVSDRIKAVVTHAYTKPGTYFPCFRVGSKRKGVTGPPVYNLARARVVVS